MNPQDMQATLTEFTTALERGQLFLRSMLKQRLLSTGVQERTHYLLAAISVVSAHQPDKLKAFFDYLRVNVPPMEQAAHDQALAMAFRITTESIMAQAAQQSHELAKLMGLDIQVEQDQMQEALTSREEARDFSPRSIRVPSRPSLH